MRLRSNVRVKMNPTPRELWEQSEGDPDEYRRLMIEHGMIVKREPGDKSPVLPCRDVDPGD